MRAIRQLVRERIGARVTRCARASVVLGRVGSQTSGTQTAEMLRRVAAPVGVVPAMSYDRNTGADRDDHGRLPAAGAGVAPARSTWGLR
jgi:hypothetical protein